MTYLRSVRSGPELPTGAHEGPDPGQGDPFSVKKYAAALQAIETAGIPARSTMSGWTGRKQVQIIAEGQAKGFFNSAVRPGTEVGAFLAENL